MRNTAAVYLVLVACGRAGFDALPDAGRDAAPPCTWSAFSAPQPLPAVVQSPDDDWYPTPAVGGLDLYFYSYRGGAGNADIWHTQRASLAATFDVPSTVAGIDTSANERAPTLTDDGLTIIYEHDTMMTDADLYTATRNTLADPFAAPAAIAELSSPYVEADPFVTADGLDIVFVSARPAATGMLDIFEAVRASRADTFTGLVERRELNSPADEYSPTLSADGLEVFFASARAGGPGGFDVYTSRRAAAGQPFSPPQLVPELSSARDDAGLRLSVDGATMYLDYNTLTAGGANADLWSATRTCN